MKSIKEYLNKKLKQIPMKPGVYLFRDFKNKVIYVGKAKILRNRVKSYFRKTQIDVKVEVLVSKIIDIEWIITDTEVEALLLENNLIKEYYPKYNIALKDGKSYPFIRITNELFPQIFTTRNIVKDGSKYFGPYTDGKRLKKTMKIINKIFPIRKCKYKIDRKTIENKKIKLCLQYQMGNCGGVCQGLVEDDEYKEMVDAIIRFLNGKTDNIIQKINRRMINASEDLEYEKAARYRNQLKILNQYNNRQNVIQVDFKSRDIIVASVMENDAVVVLFRLREGNLIGREKFYLKNIHDQKPTIVMKNFMRSYYSDTTFIPKEIFVNIEDEIELFEEYLLKIAEHRVKIIKPERGKKAKLWTLAQKNADMLLKELMLQKLKLENEPTKMVQALQEALNLSVPPIKIEGFDISYIQGKFTVASMVFFENGRPKKSEYRRYKIKSVDRSDDYASMKEVVYRRYKRLLDENKMLPDLILIDGGKGQLNVAKKILDELDLHNMPIIGLAKRLEEVFIPGYSKAQNIPKASPAVILLRKIRDEAHRFAITYHRNKRDKDITKSILDVTQGIGEKRKNILLKEFGSVKNLKKHSTKEISEKTGVSEKIIKRIFR
ncbi:MAG: excinuclease ABC subunit UvrC [Candidatus Marinimicrobia bacterium]|jgi:excinuclease ABC subunit C|nr:excinuclease ABC subunit UvrC [Candidatus Neomarinimicrobiota bacterium]